MSAGTRLFAERPLFTAPINSDKTTMFDDGKLLAALTPAQQDAFHRLYDCRLGGAPISDQGTYNTNSFILGEVPTLAGIFILTCRLNHSCLPNCSHSWNSALGVRTVHTDRDVRSGEELTQSYNNFALCGWAARQETLKSQYNFLCCCEVGQKSGWRSGWASTFRRQGITRVAHCVYVDFTSTK